MRALSPSEDNEGRGKAAGDRLDRAIAELPRGLREVVTRRQAGWSYARIAGELGLRENTGIQRYRRAIGRLPLELRAGLPPPNYRGR